MPDINDDDDKKNLEFSYEEELNLSEEDLSADIVYCKACDSPLKKYHSIVCFDCLDEGTNLFSNIINNNSEPKTIFIDSNYSSSLSDDDDSLEEIMEEEWDEEDEEYDDEEYDDEEYDDEEYDFSSYLDID